MVEAERPAIVRRADERMRAERARFKPPRVEAAQAHDPIVVDDIGGTDRHPRRQLR